MTSSKFRVYIRTADGLRRVPMSAVDKGKSYPQMANAGDMSYLQVIFWPDDQRYHVTGSLVRADETGVFDFAPNTNTFRMRIEAAFGSITSPNSFVAKRTKQLNAEEQAKYGPSVAEKRILEADIFGENRIPFLKSELPANAGKEQTEREHGVPD